MIKVLFVRHGKTRGNLEGRYVGRTDEPLLETSCEELREMWRAGAGDSGDKKPEMLFCSPMMRCRQSANCLFENCDLQICEDLRETDFGDFEYKNYEELNGNPAYQAWIDSGGMLAFPNGESGADFRLRCQRAFLACMEKAEQQGISRCVFVVHGGVIMSVLEHFARPKGDFYSWQVKNGQGFEGFWNEKDKILENLQLRP